MALTYTPLTELEAVNIMLEVIGEQPVNSLPADGVADALVAETLLHHTSREVQSLKLNCNTEEKFKISPDVNGYINIPEAVLICEPYYRGYGYNYVQRGTKLYDKTNQTLVFTRDVYLNLTSFLAFTELPAPVRNYITILAAMRFQDRVLGSDAVAALTADDVQAAWRLVVSTELSICKLNLLDSPSFAGLRR